MEPNQTKSNETKQNRTKPNETKQTNYEHYRDLPNKPIVSNNSPNKPIQTNLQINGTKPAKPNQIEPNKTKIKSRHTNQPGFFSLTQTPHGVISFKQTNKPNSNQTQELVQVKPKQSETERDEHPECP
jgi:hypothetical protein